MVHSHSLKRGSLLAVVVAGMAVVATPERGHADSLFVRGDSNQDSAVDISDAVTVLGFLFLGEGNIVPDCEDAADVNDDGALDLSDSVNLLSYLFLGAAAPPSPALACGPDPTPDALGCDSFTPCPDVPAGGVVVTELRLSGEGAHIEVNPLDPVAIELDYSATGEASCAGCSHQLVIGIEQFTLGCVFDEVPPVDATVTGQATLQTILAPINPGTYTIYSRSELQADCSGALALFAESEREPIGTITVLRPHSENGPAVTVTFKNNTQTPVEAFLIDAAGEESFAYELEAEQEVVQPTFAGNFWRFKQNSFVLDRYRVGPEPAQFFGIGLRSRPGGPGANVVFENNGEEAAEIFWLNFDGAEESHGTIEPGVEMPAPLASSQGYVWRFRQNGVVIDTYVVSDEPEQYFALGPKSERFAPPFPATFLNKSGAEVEVFWVDTVGAEHPAGSIGDDEELSVDSRLGHVYRFKHGATTFQTIRVTLRAEPFVVGLKSEPGQLPAAVTFRNNTTEPVEVVLLDAEGREVPILDLPPYTEAARVSLLNAAWRVRELNGAEHEFVVTEEEEFFAVGPRSTGSSNPVSVTIRNGTDGRIEASRIDADGGEEAPQTIFEGGVLGSGLLLGDFYVFRQNGQVIDTYEVADEAEYVVLSRSSLDGAEVQLIVRNDYPLGEIEILWVDELGAEHSRGVLEMSAEQTIDGARAGHVYNFRDPFEGVLVSSYVANAEPTQFFVVGKRTAAQNSIPCELTPDLDCADFPRLFDLQWYELTSPDFVDTLEQALNSPSDQVGLKVGVTVEISLFELTKDSLGITIAAGLKRVKDVEGEKRYELAFDLDAMVKAGFKLTEVAKASAWVSLGNKAVFVISDLRDIPAAFQNLAVAVVVEPLVPAINDMIDFYNDTLDFFDRVALEFEMKGECVDEDWTLALRVWDCLPCQRRKVDAELSRRAFFGNASQNAIARLDDAQMFYDGDASFNGIAYQVKLAAGGGLEASLSPFGDVKVEDLTLSGKLGGQIDAAVRINLENQSDEFVIETVNFTVGGQLNAAGTPYSGVIGAGKIRAQVSTRFDYDGAQYQKVGKSELKFSLDAELKATAVLTRAGVGREIAMVIDLLQFEDEAVAAAFEDAFGAISTDGNFDPLIAALGGIGVRYTVQDRNIFEVGFGVTAPVPGVGSLGISARGTWSDYGPLYETGDLFGGEVIEFLTKTDQFEQLFCMLGSAIGQTLPGCAP